MVAICFARMRVVRIPVSPLSSDALRYIVEIEREFTGQPAGDVLLGAGTWIYAREGVVA